MLEVELDIFSGMPNPKWILSEAEERELFERLSADSDQFSPVYTLDEQFSLGYRGLIVRQIKSDEGVWSQQGLRADRSLPNEFRVGSKSARQVSVAEWLLRTSERKDSPVSDDLREVAANGIVLIQSARDVVEPATHTAPPRMREDAEAVRSPTASPDEEAIARGAIWWACPSNYFNANANVFNDPAHVTKNNCYCFASNHLADVRYAAPGRRGGYQIKSLTCAEVIKGLYADGWKDGCQTNGLTIAMVIWPNYDFHFYRLVTGAPYWWWGHKPGGTPAKYTDDCGHGIYQYNGTGYSPVNCCRGNYTAFCGFFYQNNNTALVA